MDAEMSIQPERYMAFLLRIWKVSQDGKWVMRASLENIHTGERHNFSSLEVLITFLRNEALERSADEIEGNDGSKRDILSL
ncbi:MAG: hypothetical protein IT315_07280 [Anaerolineales bacterium]|nr:hypothetical protein [Anaerolineales bacterium]